MTEGKCQVPGARWQVVGGKWQMVGGKWQMAGGRCQMASAKWQVADGRLNLRFEKIFRSSDLEIFGYLKGCSEIVRK